MQKQEVYKQIISNPAIMHGKPCVKGTRIPVWLVVSMLADGMTEQEIIDNYPSLSLKNIKACLKYASFVSDYQTLRM